MSNNKLSLTKLVKLSIVASIYISISLAIAPLSFGAIQLRLSEILMLLCFINYKYSYSLIIGCLITNLFSPLGIIDIIFGTISTALACILIIKSKNLFIASLWPTVSCIIIAFEIAYISKIEFFSVQFFVILLQILIGEFIVVSILGYPIFKIILKKEKILKVLNL